MTNATFAKEDVVFKKACYLASIKPTNRQASKWRGGKGKALKYRTAAIKDAPQLVKEDNTPRI